MKKGIPAVYALGQPARALEIASTNEGNSSETDGQALNHRGESLLTTGDADKESANNDNATEPNRIQPPTQDEYIWIWKVRSLFCRDDKPLTHYL